MTSGGPALRAVVLVVIVGLPVAACGNEAGGSRATAGAGGAAGSSVAAGGSGSSTAGKAAGGSSNSAGSNTAASGTGGSHAAGSGSGGTSPSGGSGDGGGNTGGSAPVVGAHCMGGDVLVFPDEVFSDFGGPMSNCNNYVPGAPGITAGTELSVRDIELATPLAAGQPYAFSIKVTTAPPDNSNTIELWSADEKCGAAKEKLYAGVMQVGIRCVELKPTAGHTRLLMAWKGEGTRGSTDIAICPGGSCGK